MADTLQRRRLELRRRSGRGSVDPAAGGQHRIRGRHRRGRDAVDIDAGRGHPRRDDELRLAPRGGLSSGDGPFLVGIGSTVPCGTLITFQLHSARRTRARGTSRSPCGSESSRSFKRPTSRPTRRSRSPTSARLPSRQAIVVPSTGVVADVNVTINITHTDDGDLDIDPDRTKRRDRRAEHGQRIHRAATTSTPCSTIKRRRRSPRARRRSPGRSGRRGSFRLYNGIPANGTWLLRITDDAEPRLRHPELVVADHHESAGPVSVWLVQPRGARRGHEPAVHVEEFGLVVRRCGREPVLPVPRRVRGSAEPAERQRRFVPAWIDDGPLAVRHRRSAGRPAVVPGPRLEHRRLRVAGERNVEGAHSEFGRGLP